MQYIADDGSYGSAFNMVIIDRSSLSGKQWEKVEEAPDNERVMKVIELLWGTNTRVWVPDLANSSVKEIVL